MRIVLKIGAIVAALALSTATLLSAGCGQRGVLYMPTVPPLPIKSTDQTRPQPSNIDQPETPNTSGSSPNLGSQSAPPLKLDSELRSAPQ